MLKWQARHGSGVWAGDDEGETEASETERGRRVAAAVAALASRFRTQAFRSRRGDVSAVVSTRPQPINSPTACLN